MKNKQYNVLTTDPSRHPDPVTVSGRSGTGREGSEVKIFLLDFSWEWVYYYWDKDFLTTEFTEDLRFFFVYLRSP
ncbi:hypothetical protein KAW65_04925 [candidate division WOR-3 bacterium]|nr:hypothetical protein [candidate division WOR-3 bacterium]